jgi:4-cresol dehydrogenase (hydroxylating)
MARASGFQDEIADLVVTGAVQDRDLSGQKRRVAGRLVAREVSDVVRIVQAAGRHGVKIQPISCGRNWGFGSALPQEEGAWILDLSGLNRCFSYERETGTIRLGPGVTQLDLYQTLTGHGGEWFFNVTGAGHSTSVLGNALERGIGYHGQRHLDLLDLQVVTGTGEIINSRLSSDADRFTPACVGADLTQLFVQGSLGVVVSARLRLIKRTDGGGAAIVRLKDAARVADFFRAILSLKQDGCVQGVPHIGNQARIIGTMAPWLTADQAGSFSKQAASWTAALPVTGCRELTETAFGLIRARMEGFCGIETILAGRDVTDHAAVRSPVEQLQQLASGYPSNLAIPGVEWSALGTATPGATDPEGTGAGLIHVTPAVGSSVGAIGHALELIEDARFDLQLGNLPVTVNVVDLQTTVMVISVSFAASEAEHAKRKARKLEERLQRGGLRPYRIGLGQENWLAPASAGGRAIFKKLKAAFDPLEIFAASKYDASHAAQPKARAARPRLDHAPVELLAEVGG